jgi:hypothetical protein
MNFAGRVLLAKAAPIFAATRKKPQTQVARRRPQHGSLQPGFQNSSGSTFFTCRAIRHITIVPGELSDSETLIPIEIVDAVRVEEGDAPFDTMNSSTKR